MKLFYILPALLLLSFINPFQDQEIDSAEDEQKVKDAVVAWADNTFYKHSEYKFENFHAFYTDEYFIAVMRTDMYKDRLTSLEKRKAAGSYKGSDADYEAEHKDLQEKYDAGKKEVDEFVDRVMYYQISFWSNIQTTDGLTVYYEYIVKLDNSYSVTEYEENSAIGKKDSNTNPLFKKDVKE